MNSRRCLLLNQIFFLIDIKLTNTIFHTFQKKKFFLNLFHLKKLKQFTLIYFDAIHQFTSETEKLFTF